MFVIAIVLIVVGAFLLLAPVPLPNKDPLGWLALLVGAIIAIVVLLTGVDVGHR